MGSKVVHQVDSPCFATLPGIAIFALSVCIELVVCRHNVAIWLYVMTISEVSILDEPMVLSCHFGPKNGRSKMSPFF